MRLTPRTATGGFLLGCALLAAGLASGCKKAEARKPGEWLVGYSSRDQSAEYTARLGDAVQARAKERGVKLVFVDAQADAQRQISQAENFISQKVDVIILNPCEVEASSPAIDRARAAKIPVINVNSLTKAAPDCYVGSDDEQAGILAMEAIAKQLNGQGNVLMIHGIMGQSAQIHRDAGARKVLARYPGLKLLDHQTASWDRAKALALTENWLQAHKGKFQAIFAHNDEMAMGALLALERAGLKKDVYVIGVDAISQALDAVKAGRLDATVFQDAVGQGRGAIDTAILMASKQPFEKEVMIPFQVVTRENVDQFLKK